MPYRRRACGWRFSMRIGTAMESSKPGFQTWALATYLLTTRFRTRLSSRRLIPPFIIGLNVDVPRGYF